MTFPAVDLGDLYTTTSEGDLLLHALETYPERIAVKVGARAITYRDFRDELSRYCQALCDLGVKSGDRFGLLSGNSVEVLFATYACNLLGCCLVPLHPKGSLKDHAYVVEDAQLSVLLFGSGAHAQRGAELADLGIATVLALGICDGFPNLIDHAARFAPKPLRAPVLPAERVCRLSYSGGTTGAPKAIMGTIRSLLTKTIIQLVEWEWPTEVRQLVVAPLSHAGGSMLLPTLVRGGTLYVLDGFDPSEVLRTIERERITCTLLIPTMIAALLDHPQQADFDLSSIEVIFYGASPISPARLRQGIARFGKVFFQFYGQTEAPMTVCVLRRAEHDAASDARLGSCGRPVPWVRVALLDDDGNPVRDGEPGEICVQGPLVMGGYWNKPEQTAEALKGGWLHSGDVAIRDGDGFLRIVDRKKDMIISGGFNVFAREVEDVICEHPAVATCAVIGVPDPRWGEAVKAVVVTRSGESVAAEELIALVRASKGPVQAPKIVEFAASLPMTALGKPDKKALRQASTAQAAGAD
jgi:fatty-acyl-CoA synthase